MPSAKTKKIVVVVAANGKLGVLVCERLLSLSRQSDVLVKAVIRKGGDPRELSKFSSDPKFQVLQIDYKNKAEILAAATSAYAIVSCLQGLDEVIIGLQSTWLEAAIDSSVRRFIPSDFSLDLSDIPMSMNRNFAVRKRFHMAADKIIADKRSRIEFTSIYQGAFMDMMIAGQALDFKNGIAYYLGDQNVKMDYTTWEDTAHFTAHAALDDTPTPRKLCLVGYKTTPSQIADIATKVTGRKFVIKQRLSAGFIGFLVPVTRFLIPSKKDDVLPVFQILQYMHVMAVGTNAMEKLDNDRYPIKYEDATKTILKAYQDFQTAEQSKKKNAKKGPAALAIVGVLGALGAVAAGVWHYIHN